MSRVTIHILAGNPWKEWRTTRVSRCVTHKMPYLWETARDGNPEEAEALILHGADVEEPGGRFGNVTTEFKLVYNAQLVVASRFGQLPLVKLLLEHKASPDATDVGMFLNSATPVLSGFVLICNTLSRPFCFVLGFGYRQIVCSEASD